MLQKATHVYQFKITLEEITPAIWRQIQVPETYTFWDLHVAIQDSMGWVDYHLHQFEMINPKTEKREIIGIPDDEWDDKILTLAGWEIPMVSYFSLQNKKADYLYDFGDGWEHKIILEDILSLEQNQKYPICLAGARACPPEDCGGISGYERLIEIVKNPQHEEYKNMKQWLGKNFKSEEFDPTTVCFANPKERWKIAFLDRYNFI